jgi:undecaprenyl-phosphate 4-deoxy-4-formamido-L-arabinose transferase
MGKEKSRSAVTCTVVIPVYNSQGILPELARQLTAVLPGICSEYEIILVNDGSTDQSWAAIKSLAHENAHIMGMDLMRNFGQHNALLAGIRIAKYELIITMDDDLQHPPGELPKLLAEIDQGVDVVYGVPETPRHDFLRNVISGFAKRLMGLALGSPAIARSGAFRVFRTRLREAFLDFRSQFVSIDALLSWGTTRFGFVQVRHDPRYAGGSKYTLHKLIRHTLNIVTGFSALPLRFASLIGFLFTAFGFLVLVYVLASYFLHGNPVQGFPFLASIVALFSGIQLFTLGIFGEYLAHMYFRLMGRPSSVIREITGMPADQKRSDG